MRKFYIAIILSLVTAATASVTLGQETDISVVDEVIAQVNDDVITLSQVNREKDGIIQEMVRAGKTKEEAELEVNKREGEMIANLITEEMMRQKGVEMGLDKSVEADVNQRLLKLMRDNNLRSLNDLYAMMRQQGVDPESLKRSWRASIMRQQVIFQLVDLRVYWETSDKEVKEYYNKNQDKFKVQERVKLSEIFLPFAGKKEEDVITLAKSIVKRAKDGEKFEDLVIQYSERPNVAETKGYVGEFNVTELNDDIRTAIKDLRTGDIAEPIRWEIGMEIVRVDEYTPASTEANFDEGLVRRAIMEEKAPKARAEFIKKMREDSYIKVRESYRGIVMPFLRDDAPDNTASSSN